MATNTSTLSELLEPGLKKIYGDTYDQWQPEFDKIFDIVTSNRNFEEYQELTGFGLVPERSDGANTVFDDPIQGVQQRVQNRTFALGFKVTQNMFEDDLYNKIRNMPKALAFSVMQSVETRGSNILNDGFDPAVTYADGKSLFAVDHPLPGGGVFSNRTEVSSDLSMASFEQMLIDISRFINGRSLNIKTMPLRLIVDPLFEATAIQILQSGGDPETANRAINPFQNKLDLHVNHYLTDGDAWFVRTNTEGLICQKRKWPAIMTKDNDFDTDNALFKTVYRLEFSPYDPRAVYGSPGQ